MINDCLIGLRFPKIIDAQATLGIAGITVGLDVPINVIASPFPTGRIGVAATRCIDNAVLDSDIPKRASTVDARFVMFRRKPSDRAGHQFNILILRRF